MRFGVFLNNEERAARGDRDRWIGELAEQVAVASDLGFCGFSLGHHHSIGPTQWAHPVVAAARLAAVADDMDVVLGVYLVGQFHPLEVAEQLSTLDACSGGRLRLGAAPGWAKAEFDTLGIEHGARFRRFYEAIEVLKQLWTGDEVSHHGEFFDLDAIRLTLLPVQPGGPPIWLGASVPASARRAARTGDSFILSSHPNVDELEAAASAFATERTELGLARPNDRPALRNCFVAQTYDEALRSAIPHLAESYQAFAGWRMFDDVLADDQSRDTLLLHPDDQARLEEFARNRFILGDPDQVAAQLHDLERRLDVNYVLLRMQWPGMDHQQTLRSLDLFSREVMVRF